MATIAVVGGGIAGLSAAWRLAERLDTTRDHIVVLEQTDRVGGKLCGAVIAGHQVDVGAESVLARRPEAVGLIDALALDKVHPAPVPARVWSRGELHGLPPRSLMGVPSDPVTLDGLLTPDEVARVRDERPVPVDDGDISVGDLVERALGPAVVDRLVEPLLGGVYAGQARRLSAQACMPALYDAAVQGDSLVGTAAKLMPVPAPDARPTPVFASIRGGIATLPLAMSDELTRRGVQVRTNETVHGLQETADGWRLLLGGRRDEQPLDVDAVILATPARPTARLLAQACPDAAGALSRIDYASMAVITYAFPRADMAPLDGSGFLVPPVDQRDIKASTFTSVKWPWVQEEAPDLTFVRVSIGRAGEEATLQRSDDDLVRAGLADLASALGTGLPDPVDTHVQRWGGGLPQYAVGHLDLVATARDSLAAHPTISLAGAAYDGVGIPACIASGYAAADCIADQLTDNTTSGQDS